MKDTRPMAEQTWPLFERKWRRKLFWKRWKSKIFFAGSLLLVIILAFLYRTFSLDQKGKDVHFKQPVKEENLKSKMQDALQGETQIRIGASLGADLMDSLSSPFEPLFDQLNSNFQIPRLTNWQGPIQKNADLQLAFACLNIQPLTWSFQSNGHSLSALIDKQTLMIMNLMYGTDSLAEYPTDFNNESFYRPAFFPADLFVHIAFYEVGEWIQDPLTVRLNMNRMSDNVRIAPWLVSSNYRVLNSSFYRSPMPQYRKNLFVADRQPTAFNPLLFHRADTLIAVTAQAQRITQLSMYGLVCGSKEITYKSKGIHSAKRREPLLDPVDNTLYVLAPTNFHFVFFKVDLTTGCATQIYQTASIWPGAEFEIYDGILHYNYKSKEIQVDLKQIKVE